MDDLDEVGLCRHDRFDRLVGTRALVDHTFVLAAGNACRGRSNPQGILQKLTHTTLSAPKFPKTSAKKFRAAPSVTDAQGQGPRPWGGRWVLNWGERLLANALGAFGGCKAKLPFEAIGLKPASYWGAIMGTERVIYILSI